MTEGSLEEISVLIPEIKKVPKTAEQMYIHLLGQAEIPKSPEEMPENVFLPPESLGDLENSILDTDFDQKQRERIQDVWFNGKFKKGRVFLGTETFGGLTASVASLLKAARLQRKPLITYHTHSEGVGYFGSDDAAVLMRNPMEGFITMLGVEGGVAALLETKASSNQKRWLNLPIPIVSAYLSVIALMQADKKLEKHRFSQIMNNDRKVAEFFEKEGFAYYCWQPAHLFIEKGDMENGITLERIHPDKS